MLSHVVGLAEVEASLLGGELAVANIDPRREAIFAAARELYETLIEGRILPLIQAHKVRLSSSFGKDSVTLLNLFVEAHRRAKERDIPVAGPLIVTHADTKIESPVMSMFAKRQLRLLAAYLDQHGIAHRILTAEPQPRYSWPVLYVGGLKLMTVGASVTSDCTVELKINPLRALERKLEREFPGLVLATGVRLDESIARSQSIKEIGLERGEVVVGADGSRNVAPIVDLSTPEVWLLLRCMGVGAKREYGDHLPHWDSSTAYLRRLYSDQDESNCPISGSSVLPTRGGCGGSSLRSGCALCTVVNSDKQAESLTDLPQYPQLRNLLAVRNWLSNNFANMQYRRFLARKPSADGYLKLQANTMNEVWMVKVLRWLLQCDRDEQLRAEQFHQDLLTGEWRVHPGVQAIIQDHKLTPAQRIEWLHSYLEDMAIPTFELVTPTQLLLIDAFWSRDGYRLAAFQALSIWREVHHLGITVPYPELVGERVKEEIPAPVYYPIGNDPALLSLGDIEQSAVFDRYLADLASLSFGSCGGATKIVRKQVSSEPVRYGEVAGATLSGWFGDTESVPLVVEAEEGECGYTVDAEAAEWICGPMISDYLGQIGELDKRSNVALRRLISEGVLRLSVQAQRNTARLMARADMYESAGMSRLEDGDPVFLADCISQAEYERQVASSTNSTKDNEPAPGTEVMVSVEQQWADLNRAVDSVLALHARLEQKRFAVTLTLNQMGQSFRFDGVRYQELQRVISNQLQAIQLLFAKPESTLALLPSTASLCRAFGRERTQRLRLLQQRAGAAMQGHREAALRALDEAVCLAQSEMGQGPTPFFMVGGGMGFIVEGAKARDYLDLMHRLHSFKRLARAS